MALSQKEISKWKQWLAETAHNKQGWEIGEHYIATDFIKLKTPQETFLVAPSVRTIKAPKPGKRKESTPVHQKTARVKALEEEAELREMTPALGFMVESPLDGINDFVIVRLDWHRNNSKRGTVFSTTEATGSYYNGAHFAHLKRHTPGLIVAERKKGKNIYSLLS